MASRSRESKQPVKEFFQLRSCIPSFSEWKAAASDGLRGSSAPAGGSFQANSPKIPPPRRSVSDGFSGDHRRAARQNLR